MKGNGKDRFKIKTSKGGYLKDAITGKIHIYATREAAEKVVFCMTRYAVVGNKSTRYKVEVTP